MHRVPRWARQAESSFRKARNNAPPVAEGNEELLAAGVGRVLTHHAEPAAPHVREGAVQLSRLKNDM
jgi:hypothetical protein